MATSGSGYYLITIIFLIQQYSLSVKMVYLSFQGMACFRGPFHTHVLYIVYIRKEERYNTSRSNI